MITVIMIIMILIMIIIKMTIMIILKDKKTSSHLRNDENYTDHTKKMASTLLLVTALRRDKYSIFIMNGFRFSCQIWHKLNWMNDIESYTFQIESRVIISIIVTSRNGYRVSHRRQLDCLFNTLSSLTEDNMKAGNYWPLMREIH